MGTNPQNPDSDGDGVADGDEIRGFNASFMGISRTVRTNPAKRDSDGDGLGDGSDIYPSFVLMPIWLPLIIIVIVVGALGTAFYIWRGRGITREKRTARPLTREITS